MKTWSYARVPGAVILHLASVDMLRAFRPDELQSAAKEFVRLSAPPRTVGAVGDIYTPGDVLYELERAANQEPPGRAAWVVVDDSYRLLGFLSVLLGESIVQGETECLIASYYFWPKRPNLHVSPRLNVMLDEWAREHGCKRIVFTTRRDRPKAWGRLGYSEIGRVYAKTIEPAERAESAERVEHGERETAAI